MAGPLEESPKSQSLAAKRQVVFGSILADFDTRGLKRMLAWSQYCDKGWP